MTEKKTKTPTTATRTPARGTKSGGADVPALFRVNVEVGNLEQAAAFYGSLLGVEGRTAAVMRACAAAGQSSVASGPNTDAPGGTTRGGMVR